MKLLYENTKACSTDLDKKIEEMKKVMTMQMNSLTSGMPSQSMMPGTMMGQSPQMFSDDGLLDPTILQKGIAAIKD